VFLQAATRVTEVGTGPVDVPDAPGLPSRLWVAVRETVGKLGWPVLLLAAIGVWRLARGGWRGDLTAGLLAWATVWMVFVLGTVGTRVDSQFERYAVEFVGRVNLFTYPALVVLAAGAAAGLGREVPRGPTELLYRAAVVLLVVAAAWLGLLAWLAWFR
jgi:hypothetical protein